MCSSDLRRLDPELDDRVGVDQAGVRKLGGELVGVGERVHRVAWVADHERGRLERLAHRPFGRGPPEQDPLEHRAAWPRVLRDPVEHELSRERDKLAKQIRDSKDTLAKSQALIERLDALLAKLDSEQ